MTFKTLLLTSIAAVGLAACSSGNQTTEAASVNSTSDNYALNKNEGRIEAPTFPYEMTEEGQWSPEIGEDGDGFNAISHNIKYPYIPANSSQCNFIDSLLLMYNTILAFNTMAYDVSTAERYMYDSTCCLAQANALESINLSGIKEDKIRGALLACCKKVAQLIRDGKRPNKQKIKEIDYFYSVFNKFMNPFMGAHMSDVEFDPSQVCDDYTTIHGQAITATPSIRYELLKRVLAEPNFQKKCVLAREFAYANFKNEEGDDKELVAIIDPIIKSNEYSPLLYDLWLMWRTALQLSISMSNNGAMYNLFYNNMRNHVAMAYISHLRSHPTDKVAFNKFVRLAMEYNITRNSSCFFGNNALLDELSLYEECRNKN